MPSDPTLSGPGIWYLDFPSDPNYPGCVSNANCESLNYVTNSYSGTATDSVSMTFQILTTGTPAFNYVMDSDNTCATPATVRLFLEGRNDDFSEEFYAGGPTRSAITSSLHPATLRSAYRLRRISGQAFTARPGTTTLPLLQDSGTP